MNQRIETKRAKAPSTAFQRHSGRGGGTAAVLGLAIIAGFGCQAQVEPSYEGEPLLELDGRIEALTGAPDAADVGVLWLTGDESEGCSGPTRGCAYSSSGSASADSDFECLDACGDPPRECTDDIEDRAHEWAQCQTECGSDTQVFISVESHTCFQGGVAQTTPVAGDFPADFSLDVLQPPPQGALMASDTGERVAVGFFVAVDPDADGLTLSREDREPPEWLFGGSETHVLMYAAEAISKDSSWGRHLGGAYTEGYHLVEVVFGNRCGLPFIHEDSEGDMRPASADQADMGPGVDGGAAEEPAAELYPEPDYSGVPLVCGNGVCEPSETCDICSDCIECDADGHGKDSNLTSRESEVFSCQSTPNRLVPAKPGAEAEILLKLADVRLIDWPSL